jgi:hypothetical protein
MKWVVLKDGKIVAKYIEFSDAMKTYIKINGDEIRPCE